MYSVTGVDQSTVNAVLDEFLDTIKKQTGIGLGAGQYIENVLTKALGDDKAQSVLGRITPASSESQIDILDWMDARAISELILDEHPQIKALIISYLDFGLAADVLTLLPDNLQADIVRRIATLETVEPGAIKELERVMKAKFAANTSLRASQIGGVKAAAKIMNFTKTEMETRILGAIKKDDRDLMAEIQDNMFVFENLGGSDERSLQTLLRSVDQDVLVIAMKGAETALQDKLLGCMSTRAAANIRDEMEALGPVRLTEVQEAQKQIINVARKLSDDGTIVLAGRGGEGNGLMVEAQENKINETKEADYSDLQSLLEAANLSKFNPELGYTEEKQEFEKFENFFEIIKSNVDEEAQSKKDEPDETEEVSDTVEESQKDILDERELVNSEEFEQKENLEEDSEQAYEQTGNIETAGSNMMTFRLVFLNK